MNRKTLNIKGEFVVNRMGSKNWYIFIIVLIFSGALSSGCFRPLKERPFINKQDRVDILEETVESLYKNVERLNAQNYELNNVKNQLNMEYAHMKDRQVAIESAQKSHDKAFDHLENDLRKTKRLLENIKQQLAIVEKEKKGLEAQLSAPDAPHAKKAKTEPVSINEAETNRSTGKTRNDLIKDSQEKKRAALVEELLDKAIQLYRAEEFDEAIAKWNEVLSLDPRKLEAKFNIEIAQDRIKEKQIQEDLKATRTQRK